MATKLSVKNIILFLLVAQNHIFTMQRLVPISDKRLGTTYALVNCLVPMHGTDLYVPSMLQC